MIVTNTIVQNVCHYIVLSIVMRAFTYTCLIRISSERQLAPILINKYSVTALYKMVIKTICSLLSHKE